MNERFLRVLAALLMGGLTLAQALRKTGEDPAFRKVSQEMLWLLENGVEESRVLAMAFGNKYQWILERAVETGRLGDIVVSLVDAERKIAERRRKTAASLLYPLVILIGATVLRGMLARIAGGIGVLSPASLIGTLGVASILLYGFGPFGVTRVASKAWAYRIIKIMAEEGFSLHAVKSRVPEDLVDWELMEFAEREGTLAKVADNMAMVFEAEFERKADMLCRLSAVAAVSVAGLSVLETAIGVYSSVIMRIGG